MRLAPKLLASLLSCSLAISIIALAPKAATASTTQVEWDKRGEALVAVGPLKLEMFLYDYDSPTQIVTKQTVRINLELKDFEPGCLAEDEALIQPLLNGEPLGELQRMSSSYGEKVMQIPVMTKGEYGMRFGAVYTTRPPDDSEYDDCRAGSEPQALLKDFSLFTISKKLDPPASTKKAKISSSGPNWLVSNTRSRSRAIPITWQIKDKEKRKYLYYSICQRDSTYDCWVDKAPVEKTKSMKKISSGWQKTWLYWFERETPGDCIDSYLKEPDVSVTFRLFNAEMQSIGKKKHKVRLTCRM